jgi:hypothetical protein
MAIVHGSPAQTTSRPVPVPVPVPSGPVPGESIAATWCRDIADAVAALDTTVTDASYQLTLHDNRSAPRHLRVAFQTTGHHVDIDVRWPDPRQAPRVGLHIDDRAIGTDDVTHPSAPALAHAIWRAIRHADAVPPPA